MKAKTPCSTTSPDKPNATPNPFLQALDAAHVPDAQMLATRELLRGASGEAGKAYHELDQLWIQARGGEPVPLPSSTVPLHL